MEVGKLDSAYWSFNQGLKFNTDDESLLEYAAWNAGKMNNVEDQMYYIERLLEINPDNVRALERMNDTYKKNEMYEEQLVIIDLWLKIDSENKKAISDKKTAYNKLGKDENINPKAEIWCVDIADVDEDWEEIFDGVKVVFHTAA